MATTTHRPKLKRKELKQPDEFMTVAYSVEDFVEHHLSKVITGALVVLAVAAVFFLIYQHVSSVRRAAAEQFYAGFTALNSRDYKSAQRKFDAVIADHPSTRAAGLARFYRGIAYFDSGDLPKARAALEDYTQGDAPTSLRELALMDLGIVNEQMHDYAKAISAYQEAAALNGPEKNNARIAIARVLQIEGKRDAAIKAYQDFLNTDPYAPQRETVIQALANLGVNSPTAGGAATSAP
jgi:tetratricopeptide (TPR) repeat protein